MSAPPPTTAATAATTSTLQMEMQSKGRLPTTSNALPSLSSEDMRRQAKKINTVVEFINFFSSDFDGFVVCLAIALGMLGTSILLTRLLHPYRAKFPVVLAYLFVGITVRLIQPDLAAEELMIISKPFIRMSLTAVGLIIGSHLNKVTLAPLLAPMCRFIPIFSIVVIVIVSVVAALLFPTLTQYAPLVGAIALERSSPEALAGIVSAKADGLFTSTTMCTAAIQDVLALVFFVVFSSTVGTPLSTAVLHLMELACGTALAMSVTVLAVRTVERSFVQRVIAKVAGVFVAPSPPGQGKPPLTSNAAPNRPLQSLVAPSHRPTTPQHKRTASGDLGDKFPAISSAAVVTHSTAPTATAAIVGTADEDPSDAAAFTTMARFIHTHRNVAKAPLVTLLFIIPLVGWFFHVELLLAAVLAGVLLNYDSKHPITPLLEESETLINIVLFTFLGQRILLMSYLKNIFGACILFLARTVSLALGSWLGGNLAKLPPHTPETQWMHKYRWMGLITQLAIALSLVDRMEEQFKESVPMASAFGGSVLLALISGPPALQFVLSKVGEAGMAREGSDSHV